MTIDITLIYFALLGALGAFTSTILWASSWQDLQSFNSLKHLIIGAIAGFLYGIIYNNPGAQSYVGAFVAGYFAKDFIEGIVYRYKVIKKGA